MNKYEAATTGVCPNNVGEVPRSRAGVGDDDAVEEENAQAEASSDSSDNGNCLSDECDDSEDSNFEVKVRVAKSSPLEKGFKCLQGRCSIEVI